MLHSASDRWTLTAWLGVSLHWVAVGAAESFRVSCSNVLLHHPEIMGLFVLI